MVRGIERRVIFRDDRDRADFVERVAARAEAQGWTVVAWAILPNHAHLLVRSERRPLAEAMRSLLTGYAGAFNRRHKRHGHLFQNRHKSVVVEEDPYLFELVRDIHPNPLRAGQGLPRCSQHWPSSTLALEGGRGALRGRPGSPIVRSMTGPKEEGDPCVKSPYPFRTRRWPR